MITEKWLPVVGWEGFYEVSDHGRVRSLERVMTRRNGARFTVRSKVLRPGTVASGHLVVGLCKNGRNTQAPRLIHRLVLEAFVGLRPDRMECCHRDGDPTNNQLDNIRWGTRSDNLHDTVIHGVHHNARKTHCKQGHEFTPENTYTYTGKWRRFRDCRICRNRRVREHKQRLVS